MFDRACRKRKAMQMESKREPAVMGNKPLLGPRVLLKQVFYRKLRQWTYSKKV